MTAAAAASVVPAAAGAVTHRLLITGCGRSGTKYIARVLAGLGLDVRHEDLGADGAASWCMVPEAADAPWGVGRLGCRFGTVLHQVRHPLRVIPSLTTFTAPSWAFVERHVDCPAADPPLLRAAKYWSAWNAAAERMAEWTYRVEHLPAAYDEFCRRVGVGADRRPLDRTSTRVNTRRRGRLLRRVFDKLGYVPHSKRLDFLHTDSVAYVDRPFTWAELERHAPGWSGTIRDQARRYGYTDADDAEAVGDRRRG